MRNNQPVTQQEYLLPADSLLVSVTDLQGNITKANEAFVEASGFSWSELVGQPHNIVRHPDVPEQVFADFWASIQNGRPWSQIVKNRRKNGDHYWVVANATPIRDDQGRITGYMSVRCPANRQQIAQAEAIYRDIAAGKVKLRNGHIDSLNKRLNLWAHLNPQWTIIPIGIVSVLAFALHIAGIDTGNAGNLLITLLTVLASLHAMYFINRINSSLAVVDDLARGHFNTPVNTFGENIAGKLAQRLKSLQIRLGDSVNDMQETLRKTQRLEAAMNTLNANVMVADQNRTIVYANPSVVSMLSKIEKDIQTQLPHFQAKQLVGKSIDVFHQQPQHQIDILEKMDSTHITKIEIAGHHIQLAVHPIFDANQQRIGTAVEWQRNIYMEKKIQSDLKSVISKASVGFIDERMPTEGLEGFYSELASQFNILLANIETAMSHISDTMHKVAHGDLTARVHHQLDGALGKLNHDLNTSLDNLAHTLGMVISSLRQIIHNIDQLNTANQESSHRTQQTAANLQETAAAVEQITSSVQRTSENTNRATEVAHQVRATASRGVLVVNDNVSAMTEIEAHSRKIEEITSLIDSIAFQTNLLALNAAVEAARAGEHGRGFAVVAGEVRALAGKSADAARDIKALIEETVSKIRSGAQKVQSTASVLQEIENQAAEMETLMEGIAATAREQVTVMSEIHRAVENMDEITQQAAAQAEEVAAMSEAMNQQASEASQALSQFHLPAGSISAASTLVAKPSPGQRPAAALPGPKATPKAKPAANTSEDEWEDF